MRTFNGGIVVMILATVLALPAAVSAGLLAYEGFDYAHNASINGLNGGVGWASAWVRNAGGDAVTIQTAGALSYTDAQAAVLPVIGRGVLIGRTFRAADRQIASRISAPGVYWLSFLLRPDYTLTASFANTLYLELRDGTTVRARVGKVDAAEFYGLNAAGTTVHTSVSGEVKVDGVFPTQFLVVRYEIGTTTTDGRIHLFMNPNLGSAQEPLLGSADAARTGLNSANMAFNDINLAVSSVTGMPTNAGRGYYDEIRLGTTYADVTIPDPPSTLVVIQ